MYIWMLCDIIPNHDYQCRFIFGEWIKLFQCTFTAPGVVKHKENLAQNIVKQNYIVNILNHTQFFQISIT